MCTVSVLYLWNESQPEVVSTEALLDSTPFHDLESLVGLGLGSQEVGATKEVSSLAAVEGGGTEDDFCCCCGGGGGC